MPGARLAAHERRRVTIIPVRCIQRILGNVVVRASGNVLKHATNRHIGNLAGNLIAEVIDRLGADYFRLRIVFVPARELLRRKAYAADVVTPPAWLSRSIQDYIGNRMHAFAALRTRLGPKRSGKH